MPNIVKQTRDKNVSKEEKSFNYSKENSASTKYSLKKKRKKILHSDSSDEEEVEAEVCSKIYKEIKLDDFII